MHLRQQLAVLGETGTPNAPSSTSACWPALRLPSVGGSVSAKGRTYGLHVAVGGCFSRSEGERRPK